MADISSAVARVKRRNSIGSGIISLRHVIQKRDVPNEDVPFPPKETNAWWNINCGRENKKNLSWQVLCGMKTMPCFGKPFL
eukprot:scaffold4278_cov173-Amphora_coffeaeformis.AAC.13